MKKDLKLWIIGMQRNGVPVSRDIILMKGTDIYCLVYGMTRSTGFLGRVWLDLFMNRHPLLKLKSYQIIESVRAEAKLGGLRFFFNGLLKHVVKRKFSPDIVFKMDETGFSQNIK